MTLHQNGACKVCVERALPHDVHCGYPVVRRNGRNCSPHSPARLWINGSTLRVRFMGGEDWQHKMVADQAAWWSEHANLHFAITDDPEAEIRVGFDEHRGTWSFVGTDALGVVAERPTMNFAFLDAGTAAHAFGHAMGLEHEHQTPKGGAQWNEPRVMRDLEPLARSLSPAELRNQILARHAVDRVRGDGFDSQSVMRFFHPGHWTRHGEGFHPNPGLSDQDKAYVSSAGVYPDKRRSRVTELKVNGRYSQLAANGIHGEEDVYVFEAGKFGLYSVETGGNTHMVLKLYGPDSPTRLLAVDQDADTELNARIVRRLFPGRYTVQVRHCNGHLALGEYRIRVRTYA